MSQKPWPVRRYLFATFSSLALLVIAALTYGYFWNAGQSQQHTLRHMADDARRMAGQIAHSLEVAQVQIGQVAGRPGLGSTLDEPARCTLTIPRLPPFTHARTAVVSRSGQVGCSSDSELAAPGAQLHADSPWLGRALSAATPVIIRDQDPLTGDAALIVAHRFPDGPEPLGAVSLFLHLPRSAYAGDASAVLGHDATLTVVDTSDPSGRASPGSITPFHTSDPLPERRTGTWTGSDGVEQLFASADVTGTSLRVYIHSERRPVLDAARGTLLGQGVLAVLAMVVVGVAAWVTHHRITLPLDALARGARDAGADPDAGRVDERGAAELVHLARAFNEMLDIRAGYEARLEHLATHDGLTGLPNRNHLRASLEATLNHHDTTTGVAVLCLGLDQLQTISDSLGREGAEETLITVAGVVAAMLPPHYLLARSGGQEFTIIAPGLRGAEAVELATTLHQELSEPIPGPSAETIVHPSIGITTPTRGTSAEELLREASTAMIHARNTASAWSWFDSSMQARATHHLRTEIELRDALIHGQLVVHYQPLIETRSRRVVAAEALVRWNHPDGGTIPPLDFIPIAEQTGQILLIGELVLRDACAQAARWRAQGHELRISVNVTAAQVQDPQFIKLVRALLQTHGLPPASLCLEITESSLITNTDAVRDSLVHLRAAGIHLAIDDFGTGYSSLAYLKDLPVDEIKIDRSFVHRLARDPRDRHVMDAAIKMARALHLTVVAEGVETEAQLRVLQDLRCDLAQGYLFAKPQPPETFEQLLAP